MKPSDIGNALKRTVKSLKTAAVALTTNPDTFVPSKTAVPDGPFVAEVWLEWEICRGSTMYRERFATEADAAAAVKKAAMVLDGCLPTHYRDTDWHGRACWYKHEYSIMFGVRKATPNDSATAIWSTTLPGTRSYAGEHPMSHPLMRTAEDLGYKV